MTRTYVRIALTFALLIGLGIGLLLQSRRSGDQLRILVIHFTPRAYEVFEFDKSTGVRHTHEYQEATFIDIFPPVAHISPDFHWEVSNPSMGEHFFFPIMVNEANTLQCLLKNVISEGSRWSDDSRYLIFLREAGQRYTYWRLDITTCQELPVLAERFYSVSTFNQWSPLDVLLAFEADDTLYILDVETLSLRRLTQALRVRGFPAWSPDGQQIAFVVEENGGQAVYTIHVNTLRTERIYWGVGQIMGLDWR